MKKISVAIVGGTGYTGVELIRLLSSHPEVHIKYLTSRTNAGIRVDQHFPSLRGVSNLCYSDLNIDELCECDLVFFATPHGVAMKHAKQLLEKNTKIIDLAADFRLQDVEQFKHWYKIDHTAVDELKQAVYGLAEVNADAIKTANLIGNPGCYPTTFLLGLQPLLALSQQHEQTSIESRIIIDAKSGISGAGRKADIGVNFSETADNFKAYAASGHRHHAEMIQGLTDQFAYDYNVTFTPHLLPIIRGMFSTIYITLTEVGLSEDLQKLYETYYQNNQFIDVMPAGSLPETRSTRASNKLRIALYLDGKNLTILVVQDNLVKGAAGQAIQNMNLMFSLNEGLGLDIIPVSP